MEVAAALSRAGDGGIAAAEAADNVGARIGVGCDLVLAFATAEHADEMALIGAAIEARLEPGVIVGAVAQGVVGPATRRGDAGPRRSLLVPGHRGHHAHR